MKLTVEIEIELTNKEMNFLRNYFIEDRNRNISALFLYIGSRNIDDQEKSKILTSLLDKEVLTKDELDNTRLTQIGNKVCDFLDRDLKLKKLLGEE